MHAKSIRKAPWSATVCHLVLNSQCAWTAICVFFFLTNRAQLFDIHLSAALYSVNAFGCLSTVVLAGGSRQVRWSVGACGCEPTRLKIPRARWNKIANRSGAPRPPLTDVGTETAFRLDQRKHFRKSKHLLRSEVSWCDLHLRRSTWRCRSTSE